MADDASMVILKDQVIHKTYKIIRGFVKSSYLRSSLSKGTLEYRKAKRLLRVLTQDLTLNTLLVDNSKTIAEVMGDIFKEAVLLSLFIQPYPFSTHFPPILSKFR